MNINSVWAAGQADDGTVKPPRVNDAAQVPFTRLVHNIDNLSSIFETVPIDSGMVELIQRKMAAVNGTVSNTSIDLRLMSQQGDVFNIELWIVPVFSDGILSHYLYAADDTNQDLLRQHRNPVKPINYDITSF